MNKTIYIRDEDAPTWEKAREASGGHLSPIIMAALKQWLAEQESRRCKECGSLKPPEGTTDNHGTT